ncbi:hypothetical protein [Haloarchaeobius sp. DFWS5]|uniref:hypothetical protein n=1 Tax=Haloarchaeobius sp. DFWS5 TaxID=3446114 RepID=UPI003EBDEE80
MPIDHGSTDFVAFVRRYVKTWVHGLATAAMTAFGTLTVVHRGFAIVALASYLLPLVGYYFLTRTESGRAGETADTTLEDTAAEPTADDGDDADGTNDGPDDREATSIETDWRPVDLPTDADLTDVVVTEGTAYVVGDDGVLLAGTHNDAAESGDGDGPVLDWEPVLTDGPTARSHDLTAVDATADGEAVWVAGDGGALGRIDIESGQHVDWSAPQGRTDTWTDVAVGGAAGDATLVLTTGSGELLRGRYRDGDCRWKDPVKPGSGSSIASVSLCDAADSPSTDAGFCCDTNDGVFSLGSATADIERVGIDADGTPTDLATVAPTACLVATSDGVVHRYDDGRWTPTRVTDERLSSVASAGETTLAVADETVFSRSETGSWEADSVVGASGLRSAGLDDGLAIVVGGGGMGIARLLG